MLVSALDRPREHEVSFLHRLPMPLYDLLRIIAIAVVAFAGSWLGARMSLRKSRFERAFDRRLHWHERVVTQLVKLRQDAAVLRIALRRDAHASVDKLAAQLHTENAVLELVLAERFLYATPGELQALDGLIAEMNKFGNGSHTHRNPVSLQSLDDVIGPVMLRLSNEMRAELDWAPHVLDGSVPVRHLGSDPEREGYKAAIAQQS